MTLITYPYNLTPGSPEDVTQVMANFQAIQDLVNGHLSDVNFGSSVPVVTSKVGSGYKPSQLAQESAVTGQNLIWTGSGWSSSGSALKGTFARSGVLNTITGTADSSIWSVSIPGGTLSTNNAVEVLLLGDLTFSGASATMQLRTTYGGVTFYDQTASIIGGNANVRPWMMRVRLCAHGTTLSQTLHSSYQAMPLISANPTSGSGRLTSRDDNDTNYMNPGGVVNSGSTATLDIRIQFGTSGVTFNRRFAAAWVRS